MARPSISSCISALAVLVFAMPVLFVCAAWVMGDGKGIAYFLEHGLLYDYARNSLLIALLCVVGTLVMAVPAAWYVSVYAFPGRQLLEWALVLPLAVPSYIAAMIYGHMLEGAGPLQYALREGLGLAYGDYPFVQIRSLGGVVFILSITLYPYVYLLARGAFVMQSQQMLEAASMLGCARSALFSRLALPMARPAIVAGAALVMMEALADFGVASLYGVPVFTTGIYRAWLGLYDPIAAGRMAALLLCMVLAALWLERRMRASAGFHNATALYHPLTRWRATGWRRIYMMLHCWALVALGFGLPLVWLLWMSLPNAAHLLEARTLLSLWHSVLLASCVAACALCVGLLCAYHRRSASGRLSRSLLALATMGYALPGSVIAVGVLLAIITVERWALGGAMLFSATMVGVVWGCTLRFTTVSFQSLQAGLERITPAMDDVATMLGLHRLQRLRRVHLPLLSASAIAAFLLVFIDTLKELPATLLLRPFDMSTLSIRVFELASDEMLPYAAPVALLLVGISIGPVLLLNRKFSSSRPGGSAHA